MIAWAFCITLSLLVGYAVGRAPRAAPRRPAPVPRPRRTPAPVPRPPTEVTFHKHEWSNWVFLAAGNQRRYCHICRGYEYRNPDITAGG